MSARALMSCWCRSCTCLTSRPCSRTAHHPTPKWNASVGTSDGKAHGQVRMEAGARHDVVRRQPGGDGQVVGRKFDGKRQEVGLRAAGDRHTETRWKVLGDGTLMVHPSAADAQGLQAAPANAEPRHSANCRSQIWITAGSTTSSRLCDSLLLATSHIQMQHGVKSAYSRHPCPGRQQSVRVGSSTVEVVNVHHFTSFTSSSRRIPRGGWRTW